ncbi:MAG: N-6 DNA methylase [Kosmotoga sp.]|nr:MAG: N-6 DNA methylase [Kosmotoga sp.]
MLNSETKRKIDTARQILVGKIPDPKAQVEQITTALVYKFMDDMDKEAQELGGEARFFTDGFSQYSWTKLMDNRLSGQEKLDLYVEAITSMQNNPHIPQLFRDIFKGAFLPFRDPRTLTMFLKEINEFEYDHSENLGNAFEYLLSVLGSQGDAGQFRTPRHIIDFIVEVVAPKKNDTILDPACGTAGFLISAYKHILKTNSLDYKPEDEKEEDKIKLGETATETVIEEKKSYNGDLLTPDDRKKLTQNITGYDISPDMVKLALVNLYLHGFTDPKIHEYDTLSSDKRWDEMYDIILANPPFMTPKGGISPHKRFSIQAKRSEVLFVDYIAEHLTIKGKAGIIVPEGIIFQSANAYKNLRKNLIENWGLYAVVSLPGGVFQPYSGVKTSILLLDREFAKRTDEILFVKVENDGFDLGAQRRKIEKNDLPDALKALNQWKKDFVIASEVEGSLAFAVSKEKIAENGEYNLTGDRYRKIVDYSNAKWPMVELGEVCEILDSKRKPITKGERKSGIYPYYGATGILDYVQDYIFDEKLVLIGEDGAKWDRGDKTAFIATGKYWVNNHAHVLRPNRSKILDELLVEIINSMDLKTYISGITVPKLNQVNLKSIKIPLPPLEVQEQIVAEIEQYQKVIDGAKQVVENWKPSFRIDPDWPMVKLGEVCEIFGGGTPSRSKEEFWNGNIPWITSKYFTDDHKISGFENISEKGLKNSSSKIAPKGSTIIITRVSVGKFAYADQDYAINQDLTALVPKEKTIKSKYLLLISSTIADKIEKEAVGIGVKGVTRDFVIKQKIPLPSTQIQEQIVAGIQEEQKAVEECKKLAEIMKQKIEAKISEVWSYEA